MFKATLLILIIPAFMLIGNFVLMVVLGAVSHVFDVPKLALSFWQSMIVYIALCVVGSFFRSK